MFEPVTYFKNTWYITDDGDLVIPSILIFLKKIFIAWRNLSKFAKLKFLQFLSNQIVDPLIPAIFVRNNKTRTSHSSSFKDNLDAKQALNIFTKRHSLKTSVSECLLLTIKVQGSAKMLKMLNFSIKSFKLHLIK